MLKHILTVIAIISVVGCASTPGPVRYTNDGYAVAGSTKLVEVQAEQALPSEDQNALVDVWYIRVVNNDDNKDWCVGVEWRTLDYTINVPNQWFYVPARSYSNIGSTIQRTWDVGNVNITMPDAGFAVYKVLLRKPINGQCNE